MNDIINKYTRCLTVKSATDNLSKIRDFIKTSASECGFSEETTNKIVLAVDEACTNIIRHAYQYSKEGDIELITSFVTPRFSISISDSGIHFNPELVPVPDLIEYHKKRKVGGLGMFLMRKIMDEVTYTNLEDNRNQVLLVKYL